MLCTVRVPTQPSKTETAVSPDQIKHPVIFLAKGGRVTSYPIARPIRKLRGTLRRSADHWETHVLLLFSSPPAHIFVNWIFICNPLLTSLPNFSLRRFCRLKQTAKAHTYMPPSLLSTPGS